MDVRYRISGGTVSGSAALESPPLPLDSKALLLESDIFTTSARGSCGVDPGPVQLRLNIVTLSASPMGDFPHGVRKILLFVGSSMSSTFAILCFTLLAV